MKTACPAKRGFLIVEMTYTLGLLGTFALIATHLFVTSVKLMQQNGASTEIAIRFDAAVRVLRSDIAAASSIEHQNDHSLIVNETNGPTIHWQLDATAMSREGEGDRLSWNLGRPLEIKQDGAILLLGAAGVKDDVAAISFSADAQNAQVKK